MNGATAVQAIRTTDAAGPLRGPASGMDALAPGRQVEEAWRAAEANAADVALVNPLGEASWDERLLAHPEAGVFHTARWSQVLRETYGRDPVCCALPGQAGNAALLPLMEAGSRLTGRRGVSLPFSDECAPLATRQELIPLAGAALALGRRRGWKSLELRGADIPGAPTSVGYLRHILDLTPGPEALLRGLEGAAARGVRKARTSGVEARILQSAESMEAYYRLHRLTRRRHGLPPQPIEFFRHLHRLWIEPGHGCVALAIHEGRPVAGAVFLHFGGKAVYKFGASDWGAQSLRPSNLAMWAGIQWCAERGIRRLEFGRTSRWQEGLARFKRGWGAREECLSYYQWDMRRGGFVTGLDRAVGWYNHVFRWMPSWLSSLAGRVLYRHVA